MKCLSESKIQADICQALQAAGHYFFSVPNESGGRSTVGQMHLVAMGLRAGAADLVVVLPAGEVVFLEVKNATGKQSPRQEHFQKRVESLGHKYFVVRSPEDALGVLGS